MASGLSLKRFRRTPCHSTFKGCADHLVCTGRALVDALIALPGGKLNVVIGAGVPPARLRVHFKGVTDLDSYTSGGEDWYSLPQRLNSFTYRDHQVEGEYHWWLLGDGTEWSFLAAYPEVVPL